MSIKRQTFWLWKYQKTHIQPLALCWAPNTVLSVHQMREPTAPQKAKKKNITSSFCTVEVSKDTIIDILHRKYNICFLPCCTLLVFSFFLHLPFFSVLEPDPVFSAMQSNWIHTVSNNNIKKMMLKIRFRNWTKWRQMSRLSSLHTRNLLFPIKSHFSLFIPILSSLLMTRSRNVFMMADRFIHKGSLWSEGVNRTCWRKEGKESRKGMHVRGKWLIKRFDESLLPLSKIHLTS